MEATDPQRDKKYILVDTCVIQYSNDKNKSKTEAVLQCLASLKTPTRDLAISEITVYENLYALWGNKRKKALQVLSQYEKKIVSARILLFASLLAGLYSEERLDSPDMGDKIIAATAILEGGFVLTANHRDFPSPFFTTEKSLPITYKIGQVQRTIDLALYKPDFALISRRIEEKEKQV